MKRWLIGASIAFLALAAQALPTVSDVQAQLDKGNTAQAESMMREVVDAKPGSARAHYIYAEILAKNAKFGDASREAALARQSDPQIKFTKPEQFRSFEQMLEREQQRARAPAPSTLDRLGPAVAAPVRPVARPAQSVEAPASSSGLPGWVWPVGLAVLAVVAWKMLRRPAAGVPMPNASGAGYAPAPYGGAPGYGPAGPGMGMGGGMASPGGGLMGVGLAAAGGAAAGMLAERLLERGRDGGRDVPAGSNAGFFDPSPGSDDAARALEDRSVDFGTGGNDWDAGGSVDVGGGSDSGSSDGGW